MSVSLVVSVTLEFYLSEDAKLLTRYSSIGKEDLYQKLSKWVNIH